ncbi:MAG: hypothetical protein AB8G99_10555 [Planctomycetaceae bacterium]
MNRFLTLSIFSIALLTNALASAQEAGASESPGGDGGYFSPPMVTNALFVERDAAFHLPSRVVGVEHLATETTAVDQTANEHQPRVLGVGGNDLSFLDDDSESDGPTAVAGNASTLLWQLAAVLAFTLMAVALVFVKKSMHKSPTIDAGQLALIGTISLSHRSVVQLVAAGNSVLAVASDTSGVKSMVRIPQQFSDMLEPEPETTEAQHV